MSNIALGPCFHSILFYQLHIPTLIAFITRIFLFEIKIIHKKSIKILSLVPYGLTLHGKIMDGFLSVFKDITYENSWLCRLII